MSVITVERIKLFSTRSPWWCMVVAAFLTVGFAALTDRLPQGSPTSSRRRSSSPSRAPSSARW